MGRVVVIGSINVDLVVRVPRLPGPGDTVLGDRFERHFGGKGANQAVAAARAGASVVMIGATGSDEHGTASLAALAAEGIDAARVTRVDAPTGVALISVAPDGENQISVAPGANSLLTAAEVVGLDLGAHDIMLASLEVPLAVVLQAAETAAEAGAQVIVNPAPPRSLPAALLALGPILTPNRQELLMIGGSADESAALAALARAGARVVIVTRGAGGAELVSVDRRRQFAAMSVSAVDATGAGDTFSGVLAAWLAAGALLEDATEAANAAAALSVTRAGARDGMPQRAAILAAIGL